MITDRKKSIKDIILKAIAILTAVIPFTLSWSVFTGFNHYGVIMIALILSLYFAKTDSKKHMAVSAAFLIILFISTAFGNTAAFITLLIIGFISTICFILPNRFSLHKNPVTAGVELATALTVTVLLTTYYFGIGASGNNVKDMISSYLSLGFHPNWRGVLYGTIVMVIMITFPRKFKRFCKVVKAPFIAIVVTLILNLFLNPPDMPTSISEIGNFSLTGIPVSLGLLGRIPVHSLAVVMIVGAWESVNWGEIKNAFSSPVSVICFALAVVSTLYFGYFYGIMISAVLYIIYNFYFKKANKNETNQSA